MSDDLHELLISSVIDYAIFMLDREGRVISWNPGAERIKGYSESEILGQHFSKFYTEEDREAGRPQAALETALNDGRFTAEAWRVRRDGSRFWAMVVIDPVRRGREVIGFAKITRDMTEARVAQLQALQHERKFRLLVQNVRDYAICMLDTQGCVTDWNSGAQEIKGYAEAEIIGRHFSIFYTPEDRAAGLPEAVLNSARASGHVQLEGWRVRKDGSRFWGEIALQAIHEGDDLVGFAKITRDLTEKREAQLEIEQSRNQLFQSQKLEAIGQLTGGIAHDFNNLLTGIIGSLEMLRTRIAQGRTDSLDRYISTAHHAAMRASSLTHRLLAFARRQTLVPRAVDANKLLAGMEELLARTVGPSIRIETVFSPGLWATLCDPHQLETAVLNLCINARDAMPDGGVLTLETGNAFFDSNGSQARDMAAGQYIAVCISDTGVGMPKDVRDRAFDPFYTTKPIGQGTGLGLSMVYGFAKQSGGQVRLYSELGVGTTVRLYLPRHLGSPAEAEADVPPSLEELSLRGDKQVVLVVDDEPSVLMLVTEVLKEIGLEAVEATDAAVGLRILQSTADIALLITDVGLPGGMNGRQLADAARQLRPELEVLFITGYAENAAISNGHLAPGMHVLTKPFAMSALAARVRAILGAK